jgi:hypothetical protein
MDGRGRGRRARLATACTVVTAVLGVGGCLTKHNPFWGRGDTDSDGGSAGSTSSAGTTWTSGTTTTTATTTTTSAGVTTDAATTGTTSASTGADACSLSLDESFPMDEGSWVGSDWEISNDRAARTQCSSNMQAFRYDLTGAWRDAIFEADLMGGDGCGSNQNFQAIGILARTDDNHECAGLDAIYCYLDFIDLELALGLAVGGCTSTNHTTAAIPELTPGEVYHFAVRAEGDEVSCTVTGGNLAAPVKVGPIDGAGVPMGSVSVYSDRVHAEADNVRVCIFD